MGTKPPSGPHPISTTGPGRTGSCAATNGHSAASQLSSGVTLPEPTPHPLIGPLAEPSLRRQPHPVRHDSEFVAPSGAHNHAGFGCLATVAQPSVLRPSAHLGRLAGGQTTTQVP